MKTYIIFENGNKTSSIVLASDNNQALEKANSLNTKHKMYTGVLSVQKATF